MEKISLKPIAKELLHKNGEPNTHFDVLCYEGSNNQEKSLGSLYLVGHIKYDDEDLGYMVSLVSSLARREFFPKYPTEMSHRILNKECRYTLAETNIHLINCR